MSEELKKRRPNRKDSSSVEEMFIWRKMDKRDFKNKSMGRSRSNTSSKRCYTYNMEGHFKKECLEKKKEGNEYKGDDNGDADVMLESEGLGRDEEALGVIDDGVLGG